MALGDRKSMQLLYDIFAVIGVIVVVGVAYKVYKDRQAAPVEPPVVTAPEATVNIE
jgi:uncharacterized membrane protein YebE (DUF533 family)